jgi:hypothetical protein
MAEALACFAAMISATLPHLSVSNSTEAICDAMDWWV